MNWPWGVLGLDGPAGLASIRRAYAGKLKTTRPEEDPEGFQRLHKAYQDACRLARRARGDGFRTEEEEEQLPGGQEPEPDDGDCPEAYDQEEPDGGGEDEPEWEYNTRRFSRSGEYNEPPPAREPERRERDWDFERLFAEGEAEERGERFRRAEKLRRANRRRYSLWSKRRSQAPEDVGRDWIAASTALRGMELLDSMEAGLSAWRSFLGSDIFLEARDNPDFVLGLEAFIRERPELPAAVRGLLFEVYGFGRGRVRWEYRPLWKLLAPGRMRRQRRARLAGLAAALVVFGILRAATYLDNREARSARSEIKASAASFTRELREFAAQWDYGLTAGDPTGYYLYLPLTGAGEGIDALGVRLASLEKEERTPPEYELFLCWQGWCFYRCSVPGEAFDAAEARSYYEETLGIDMCRVIAEKTGAAAEDIGEGYTLSGRGWVTFEEDEDALFFWASGAETPDTSYVPEDLTPAVHYLLSQDGGELFCLPPEMFREELALKELYDLVGETRAMEGMEDGVTVRDYVRS